MAMRPSPLVERELDLPNLQSIRHTAGYTFNSVNSSRAAFSDEAGF